MLVMQRPHLPDEILEIIISELVPDPREDRHRDSTQATLASCRLVSHVLCSITTPFFFSYMILMGTRKDRVADVINSVAEELSYILTISDLVASVQTLELCFHNVHLRKSINGTLLSAIIYHLPNIRYFTLAIGDHLKFSSITEDFALAIRALCRSPNLITLDLDNIGGFPIMAITASPNLRILRLAGIRFCVNPTTSVLFGLNNPIFQFDDANPVDETPRLQSSYLESLKLDYSTLECLGSDATSHLRITRLFDMPFAKYFSRIKSLQLEDSLSYSSILVYGWDIMILASQSLTTLDLSCWNEDVPDKLKASSFDLGQLPALRHLKIRVSVPAAKEVHSFLNGLLSIPSHTSGIETLEINITWNWVEYGCGKALLSPEAGWSSMDEIFTSGKFVSLWKVVFGLKFKMKGRHTGRIKSERESTLACVDDLFPMFRASTNVEHTLEMHVKVV